MKSQVGEENSDSPVKVRLKEKVRHYEGKINLEKRSQTKTRDESQIGKDKSDWKRKVNQTGTENSDKEKKGRRKGKSRTGKCSRGEEKSDPRKEIELNFKK
jgi:hypothetical protein